MEVICRVSGGLWGATQYRGHDGLGQVEYNVLLYDVVGCDAGGLVVFVVEDKSLCHDDGPSSFRRFSSALMGALLPCRV